MKKISLFCTFVLAAFLAAAVGASIVEATAVYPQTIVCPENYADVCDAVSDDAFEFMKGYALDMDYINEEQVYIGYNSKGLRRAYFASVSATNYESTEGFAEYIPDKLVVPLDYVCIQDMGICVDKYGNLKLWRTLYIGTTYRVNPIATRIDQPIIVHYTQILNTRQSTYIWYSADLLVSFDWVLRYEEGKLVFELSMAHIQYYPISDSYSEKNPDLNVHQVSKFEDAVLNVGDKIAVAQIHLNEVYFDTYPGVSRWTIHTKVIAFVTYKDDTNGYFYGTPLEISTIDNCEIPYWPEVGQVFIVAKENNGHILAVLDGENLVSCK